VTRCDKLGSKLYHIYIKYVSSIQHEEIKEHCLWCILVWFSIELPVQVADVYEKFFVC